MIIACNNTVYENFESFENNSWNTDSIITFSYIITDTASKYDLSLLIRHSVDYEFQNLFVLINSDNKTDTAEIFLADKTGKWRGNGISNIREFEYVFEKGKKINKKGEQFIFIEQAMRYGNQAKIQELNNILDVGLIIRKQNE